MSSLINLDPAGETTYSDLAGDTVRWLPTDGLLVVATPPEKGSRGIAVALSAKAAHAFGQALLRYAERQRIPADV